jgi:glycosyltransferase involved in cell wall biosynthesis
MSCRADPTCVIKNMGSVLARPRLSLCMIVRDEIACLQRCLDSVKHVVDEIVIVDTGSTDGTLDLAKKYASRLAQIAWIDDFSYARNISIDMATGDWILVLDADDYLREESCSDLLQSLRESDVLAYNLMVRDHHEGGYCETSFVIRLFRRMPTVRYSGKVHEQVTPPLLEIMKSNPKWRNATLKNVIIEHDGYVQQRTNKRSRNILLLTRALEDDPSDIYRRFKLAQALGSETDTGFHHLSIALEALLHLSDQEIQEKAFAHELMGNAALRLAGRNEPKKALQICAIAESLFSRHPVLSFVRALSYYLSQDIDNSLSSANEALSMVWPAGNFVCNPDWLREDIYLLISRIRQERGEYSLTVSTLKNAVAEFPNSRRLVHALIRNAVEASMPLVALDTGAKWMKSNGLDADCLLLCADAAEKHGDPSSAARWRLLAGKSGA